MLSTIKTSVFIALLGLHLVTSGTIRRNSNPPNENQPCIYSQIDGWLTADCQGLQLNMVPDDLTPGIKTLDLRNNNLETGDFSRYQQLQVLLLDNNNVRSFESLQGLIGLRDLSLRSNLLQKVSSSLVKQLPNLRRLDLSENDLVEPLDAANLIAPLCDLQELVLENTEKSLDFCDCVILRNWTTQGLQVSPPEALECKERIGWVMEGEAKCLQAIPEDTETAHALCRNRQAISTRAMEGTARDDSGSEGIPWWAWLLISLGIVMLLVVVEEIIRRGQCECCIECMAITCLEYMYIKCLEHVCTWFFDLICCC